MKKLLYIFLGLLGIGIQAVAASENVTSSDGDYISFGYCESFYEGTGTGGKATLKAAILIPREISQRWGEGCKVTRIQVVLAEQPVKDITLFINDTKTDKGYPGAENVYSQAATVESFGVWNDFALDTPYEIGDKDFFVGYQIAAEAKTYPLGTDGVATENSNGDYFGVGNVWQHAGTHVGNMCIRITVEGDHLPQYSVALNALEIPRIIKSNEDFTLSAYVENNGVRTIDAAKVSCKIGDEIIDDCKVTLSPASLMPGRSGVLSVEGLHYSDTGYEVPLTVDLDYLNGVPNESTENSITSQAIFSDETYKRAMVVEEWTGTWCGNCPVGIVGMNYMNEHYGDSGFVGIAVHGGDEMTVNSYMPFLNLYAKEYPECIINRTVQCYPNKSNLIEYYDIFSKTESLVNIELSATCHETKSKGIDVAAKVKFGMDVSDSPYRLAFVITENDFGPYNQLNYYASDTTGELPGWSGADSRVLTYFNEVARDITTCFGIANSLPASVSYGTEYEYSTNLSAANVVNLSKCDIIALVLNSATNEIENAVKVKPDLSGINGVAADDADAIVDIYGIDGLFKGSFKADSLPELPRGIYILKSMNQGKNETRKIIVK